MRPNTSTGVVTPLRRARTIVLLVDIQGHIIRFNRYFERLSGYSSPETRGADWFDVFVPKDQRAAVAHDYFQRVVGTAYVEPYTSPILTRQGVECDVRWSVTTLVDTSGEVAGVLACGQDVTDLNRAQERALQAERLAAIGEMMTGLATESGNAISAARHASKCWHSKSRTVLKPSIWSHAPDGLRTIFQRSTKKCAHNAAPIRLNREEVSLPSL